MVHVAPHSRLLGVLCVLAATLYLFFHFGRRTLGPEENIIVICLYNLAPQQRKVES